MLSALATEHVQRPRNRGPLEGATHIGRFGIRGEGPYVTLWLIVESGRIVQAAFETYGCPSAIACASLTSELLKGRSPEEALRLEPNDLITVLGGLPEGKAECAEMSVIALRDAFKTEGEN